MWWSRPHLPGSPVLCWWRRKMARWGFASITVSWTGWQRKIFTLPRCGDIVAALTVPAHFTHVHLVRGYWHIPVAEQHRERTAFLIPDGLFQLRIMPFGLTNASATFRRATNTTLYDRNWLATTWFSWMTLLSLLARMGTPSEARRGVAATLGCGPQTQCKQLEKATRLLRYVVDRGEIVTDPEKINVLRDWSPHRVSGLHPSWAARDTPPIHPQLRRSDGATRDSTSPKSWTRRTWSGTRSRPNRSKESFVGYGARRSPSLKGTVVLRRQSSLAIVWGMEHFELGKSFTVRSDHRALKWLRSFKNQWAKIHAGWKGWPSLNSPSIAHRLGRLHRKADGLFRFPWTDDGALAKPAALTT